MIQCVFITQSNVDTIMFFIHVFESKCTYNRKEVNVIIQDNKQ